MATVSRLTGEDVTSRYEALDAGRSGPLFNEYAAHDRALNRGVRIRLLHNGAAAPELMNALNQEIGKVAALSHPAIEKVLDLLSVGKTLAIVLEPLRGAHLEERIRKVGAFPTAYAVDVATAIAEAIQAAHHAGVTHGDLKPSDVFLSAEGIVKVCGFGLQQALAAAAPSHQANPGVSPTPAADLPLFGSLLFTLLTGRLSPPASDVALGPSAFNARVPAALSNLCRCLPAGSSRYPSMDEVLRDLRAVRESIRTGQPMPAIPPPMPPEPPRRGRKTRVERPPEPLPEPAPTLTHGALAAARESAHRGARPRPAVGAANSRSANGRKREPRRRPALWVRALRGIAWLLFLTFLPIAAGIGAFLYLNYLASTPEVSVPALRGKTVDQARSALSELGLRMKVIGATAFDDTIPPGSVLQQMPEPGIHTKPPRTVRVFLSRGSRVVRVPLVQGKPMEEAKSIAAAAGLRYKSNGSVSSATDAYGTIVKQWPPAGRVVPRASRLSVLVSAGPSEADLENAEPDTPQDRTVSFTIPGPKTAAPHHVEIHEKGPSGDDKLLWDGDEPAGLSFVKTVTVDPYYHLSILLDGQELQTRIESDQNQAGAGSQ